MIELLIAAMLMAVAAVGLASVMHNGLKLWKRSENEMKLQQEARAVLDQMGKDFRNAIPVPGATWSAQEREITFSTGTPAPRILKVTYRLSSTEPAVLSRREQALNPEQPGRPTDTTLTTFPARVEWNYAYRSDSAPPVRWEKEWTEDALPAGLRIQLTLVDANAIPQVFTRTIFSPVRELKLWKR